LIVFSGWEYYVYVGFDLFVLVLKRGAVLGYQ